jgi:hypothetical protein
MQVTSNLNCGGRSAKGFEEAAFVVRRSCDRPVQPTQVRRGIANHAAGSPFSHCSREQVPRAQTTVARASRHEK